jgi:hypothetical protein
MALLQLIVYQGAPRSVGQEAQGFGRAMLDPERAESPDAIRYERLGSIGDEAMAVVERSDQAKGLLGNLAFLVAQRGIHLLFISAADLAAGDRTEALKVLERLGRAAMNRL